MTEVCENRGRGHHKSCFLPLVLTPPSPIIHTPPHPRQGHTLSANVNIPHYKLKINKLKSAVHVGASRDHNGAGFSHPEVEMGHIKAVEGSEEMMPFLGSEFKMPRTGVYARDGKKVCG
uniref:Uncharacterized protein n=1 Tax=Sphaerodactylus townsendi TaxID=933632 RepID=A0ACB8EMM0_9SAUR